MDIDLNVIWTLAGVGTAAWIITGAALLCALLLLWWVWRLRRIPQRAASDDAMPIEEIAGYPPVSVIVYAHSDERTLEELVEQIYSQDYPAEVEVIVAVDQAYDATDEVVCRLQQRHPYLRHTFAPLEARSVSRKKLALTLGVKAAANEAVVITAGNCRIPSETWLRRMMRHVAGGRTLVAGHSVTVPMSDDTRSPGLMQRFDSLRDHARWFTSAIGSYPRRSSACNLVYTRSAFFANNGFASSLGLNYGDDDILVSELARLGDSAVELSADSRVESREERPGAVMRLERLRHDFTSRRISGVPRLWFSAMSLTWWLWTGLTVAGMLLSWPHLIPVLALAAMAIAVLAAYMLIWSATGRALGLPVPAWSVPWLMWTHPLYALRLRLYGLRHRRDNYTWNNI